ILCWMNSYWTRSCGFPENAPTPLPWAGLWRTSCDAHMPAASSSWPAPVSGTVISPPCVTTTTPRRAVAGGRALILLDTSLWVEIFRRPNTLELSDIGDLEDL